MVPPGSENSSPVEVPGTPYLTPSSGDTIPNSEKLSMVSPTIWIQLRVLLEDRGQQCRVRSDVRARLTRGLEAPLIIGLLPDTRLQHHELPELNPIFIIPGAARRHERLPSREGAPGGLDRASGFPFPL
jgi:hypothetical protein